MGHTLGCPNNRITFQKESFMPDTQLPMNAPGAAPTGRVQAAARWLDDSDIALGCESADPALQIERWSQEFLATTTEQ